MEKLKIHPSKPAKKTSSKLEESNLFGVISEAKSSKSTVIKS
jgi:hypothetical protein